MNRDNALVAVSTGLLRSMQQDEVEAVLGHEVSHIANGDMVTLTLIQGVVNTFVMFMARVIGYAIDRALIYTAGGYTATNSKIKTPFGNTSETLNGWTIGAGIDYAFTDNIFGRLEYRYNDFGKKTYTIQNLSADGKLSDHVVNVGLGVKF